MDATKCSATLNINNNTVVLRWRMRPTAVSVQKDKNTKRSCFCNTQVLLFSEFSSSLLLEYGRWNRTQLYEHHLEIDR